MRNDTSKTSATLPAYALFLRIRAKLERTIIGLDFQGGVTAESLGLDPQKSHDLMPSGDIFLTRVLTALTITSNDAILDIGCGKGDAMRAMQAFPFMKIDGVEIARDIAKIAHRNFSKLRAKRTTVFNVDATLFEHYNNYNFFYFYNPFPKIVMEDVLAKICRANTRGDREIVVIYNNPVCRDLFDEIGFHLLGRFDDRWGNGIHIYSNTTNSQILTSRIS